MSNFSLPTRPFVELSTAHITAQDAEDLATLSARFPISVYEEGFFISVPLDPECFREFLSEVGLSEMLRAILRWAHENRVPLVRLDRDADVFEQLPTSDW